MSGMNCQQIVCILVVLMGHYFIKVTFAVTTV